jgi:aldehyde dehydrogenase (NAD+)
MIDPSHGEAFAAIASGAAADIDRAVKAAHAARDGAWGRLRRLRRAGCSRSSAAKLPIMPTSSR